MHKSIIIVFVICFCLFLGGCDVVSKNFDENKSIKANGITSIEVNTTSTDINLYSKDIDTIEVYMYGNVQTNNEANLPKLDLQKRGSRAIIDLERDNTNFGFNFYNSTDLKVDVYIPNEYKDDLVIVGSSSDLEITDVKPKYLKINTSSGDIDLNNIESERVNLVASSGEISLNEVTGNTQINTSSGDIEVNGVEGELTIKTSSGESEIKNVNGETKVIASSGDIDIDNINNELYLKTTSGEIDAKSISISKSASLQSTSGDISLELLGKQDIQIDVTTNTGNIECEYKFDEQSFSNDEDFFKGKSGEGINIVHIVTTSGDVEIK